MHIQVFNHYKTKDTSMTFWAERIFSCHAYDTSMTIIVTKACIIIGVVGSYFYNKKIMTENGLFIVGRTGMHLHDILWAVHDGKNHGRSEGEEISGSSWLRWVVGAERCALLSYTYARVRGIGI